MSNQNLPNPSSFDYMEWRKQFIQNILRLASLGGIVLIIAIFQSAPIRDRIIYLTIYAFIVLVAILPASYTLRSYTLLLMTFAVGINTIIGWGPWSDGTLFLLASIILASLLIDQRVDLILLVSSTIGITIISFLEQANLYTLLSPNVPPVSLQNWFVYGVDFFIAGVVLIIATGQFKNTFTQLYKDKTSAIDKLEDKREKLEVLVAERTEELESRTKQLRTTTNIARTIAEIQDPSNLLQTVANLITSEFGHYHVGVYIIDEQKKSAILQSSSSEAGKLLIGELLTFETIEKSAFTSVIEKNKYAVYSDTESEHFVHEDNFPITRSRLVLPLSLRGNVLGILDIHSDQHQAFTTEDTDILQPLADLIAITFDNLRLLNNTSSLLAQLEDNSSANTDQVWTKLTSRNKPAYQYTPVGVRPIFSKSGQDDDSKLKIPLTLHGQIIGMIKLQRKGSKEEWSQKEQDLLKKISEQVALAIENSRLVDEAQKNAKRDQMLANISSKIRETLDIESVAKTAAIELRRIFDLKEAEISIGLPQTDAAPNSKSTGALRLKK